MLTTMVTMSEWPFPATKLGPQPSFATLVAVTDQAAGFYAVAYNWNGQKVISYRGTTFELGINTYRDVIQGWTLGLGFPDASQAQLAKQFYTSVTGQQIYGGAPPSNVILTGHSLGGGLAGFVAALTGAKAEIFNNIPFGSGAVADVLTQVNNRGQYTDFLGAIAVNRPAG